MTFWKDGVRGKRKIRRHQLVYFQFHKEADYTDPKYGSVTKGCLVIDHIDSNKQNNKLDNLRLITTEKNVQIALIGRAKNGGEGVVGIDVYDCNNIVEFEYQSQAIEKGFDQESIGRCINKKALSHAGRIWLLKEDYEKMTYEEIREIRELAYNGGSSLPKKIYSIDVDTQEKVCYNSLTEAGNGNHTKVVNICRALKQETEKYGKKWYYETIN